MGDGNSSMDPYSQALGAGIGIVSGLLAQHSARLQGARTENAAIPQVVSAFDADIAQIVDAYNTGTDTVENCIQACAVVDSNIYSYLRTLQNKPGTAWNDSVGMAGQCNKQCTAACCVYFGDLGPVLSLMRYVMGDPSGNWGQSDPRLHGNSIDVPTVFGSKYGGKNRTGYKITLSRSVTASSVGAIEGAITQITGGGSLAEILSSGQQQQASSPLGSSRLSNWLLLGVVLFFGFAILVSRK